MAGWRPDVEDVAEEVAGVLVVVAGLVDESASAAVEEAAEAADVEDEVVDLLCLSQPGQGAQPAVGLVEVRHWNFYVEVGSCLCNKKDKLTMNDRNVTITITMLCISPFYDLNCICIVKLMND